MTKLKALPVPIPPAREQARILLEVEKQLSELDNALTGVETSESHSERLRQSILKLAFEGKLVPQEPNDEPGSLLLERIRAERAERVRSSVKIPKSKKIKPVPVNV